MSDWIAETLDRPPLHIMDDTTLESLQAELKERLEALLASHNGLEPNAEGWRALALALALKHESAFKIETPVDRDSLGGRPIGFKDFYLRSMIKREISAAKKDHPNEEPSQQKIAKIVARRAGMAFGTINNLFSKDAVIPDSMRRGKYELVAEKALKAAAISLSQE